MSSLDVPGYFSSITGLGRLIEYYPLKNQKRNRTGSVIIAVVCLASALLILGIGSLTAYQRYYLNGPAVVLKFIAVPAAGAAILLTIGLVSVIGAIRSWNKGVAIYEDGMAYSDLHGITAWRWQDIASVQMDIVCRRMGSHISAVQHTYILKDYKNKAIMLDESLKRVEQLGMTIREQATPLILADRSRVFRQGSKVQAGPLTLDPHAGILAARGIYPWPSIQQVYVKNGLLSICFRPKPGGEEPAPLSIPTASVPNLEVILALIESKIR